MRTMRSTKQQTLKTLGLTNGEGASIEILFHFLSFMKREGAPVPNTQEEADKLLTRYMLQDRKEGMDYARRLIAERKGGRAK